MCTSIVSNRNKTIVGWNLDILNMEYRVRTSKEGVYIEINDAAEGWMPLFGANNRGDFVGMPTCWPFDARSNGTGTEPNVIMLDIDLLTQKKTLWEIKECVAFAEMMEKGCLKKCDPEILAFSYSAPISVLIRMCDRSPEKEPEAMEKIDKFVKQFIEQYGLRG